MNKPIVNKIPIRRDENLLKMAQRVFGEDIVKDAYVCSWFIVGSTPPGTEVVRLNKEMYKPADFEEGAGISFDMKHIRLALCSGQVVDFKSSEWASMANPIDESYEA